MLFYVKYLTTQHLDEGFVPIHPQGKDIFYRTADYPRYKQFKGHVSGELTPTQIARYDRHAKEIAKLLSGNERVISLGGGTGALEQRLKAIRPECSFTVSDIYERHPVDGVTLSILDMSDAQAVQAALGNHDTVLICNALSPMKMPEISAIFRAMRAPGIGKVIVYSAEDMRPLGVALTMAKRVFRPRKTLWCGYYYSSGYIRLEAHTLAGLRYSHTWRPKERGWLTPVWGSTYLSVFTREQMPRPDVKTENLLM